VETSPKRILVVEDERFLRRVHEAGLKQRGFTVLTAADGEEGVRIARTEVPDLILLDLIMPRLQGFEVLRLLKADPVTSPIPVVVLSSLGSDGDIQAALKGGAVSYLIKNNLSVQELAAKVEEALAGRQSGSRA